MNFDRYGIQHLIVLYQPKRPILLNEEDQRFHWGFRWPDLPGLEVLLQESIQFHLFNGREGVKFAVGWLGSQFQLYGMVTNLLVGRASRDSLVKTSLRYSGLLDLRSQSSNLEFKDFALFCATSTRHCEVV